MKTQLCNIISKLYQVGRQNKAKAAGMHATLDATDADCVAVAVSCDNQRAEN